MSQVVLAKEIYSPVDVTFAYLQDLERAPEWWANVVEIHRLDEPGPVAAGSRFSVRYSMLGRQLNGLLTVAEVTAGQRLRYDVEGQVRAHFRWELTATAKSRTRVIAYVEYDPPGILGRAFDVIYLERRNAADGEHAIQSLKDHLEAEAIARIDAHVV